MWSRFCGQVLRKGFVPKGTVVLAAKRLYKTAQGFSPGLRERGIRPESGGRGESLGYLRAIPTGVSNVGCHFQGTFHGPPDPGLKPWAVLYSRFAAKLHTSLRDKTPDTCLQNRLHITNTLQNRSRGRRGRGRLWKDDATPLLAPQLQRHPLSTAQIQQLRSRTIRDRYFQKVQATPDQKRLARDYRFLCIKTFLQMNISSTSSQGERRTEQFRAKMATLDSGYCITKSIDVDNLGF